MSRWSSFEGAALPAQIAGLVAGLVPPGMGPGAWGKMLVRRVGSGGVEGRGPEVLGGQRSAVRRLGVRRPANIIGNIRRGSENIITNIWRVLGGSAGGLGGQWSVVRQSGPGGGVRIGGSPYITPPLECGVPTHRPNKSRRSISVAEGQGVERGGGDAAWLPGVFSVKFCDGFRSKDIGVLHPLVVRCVVPLEPDEIPQAPPTVFGVQNFLYLPFGFWAGSDGRRRFLAPRPASEGIILGEL